MSEPDHLPPLADLACPDGGWGYAPGQQPHLEPTCLALLALARDPERYRPLIDKGQAWLATCAAGDGTYRLGRGRREAAWPTALVLFVQSALGADGKELEATAAALLGLRGRAAETQGDED